MSIRSKPIYLSYEVYSWLRLIGKATPAKNDACQIQTTMPDEIADTLLRQAITEKHPNLVEYQKQNDKREQEIIQSLQPK